MQSDSRLAAIVIACAGFPGMSLAQSVDTSSAIVEQVIVTGLRVKRPEYEGNIPGVQTGTEQIDARNFTNAVEVLNDIPLVGGGATPNGTNGGQAASIGASFIDLLDLGTSRTLTLINSRRAVSGNAGSLFVFGNETGTQVDVNIIPTGVRYAGGPLQYRQHHRRAEPGLASCQLHCVRDRQRDCPQCRSGRGVLASSPASQCGPARNLHRQHCTDTGESG